MVARCAPACSVAAASVATSCARASTWSASTISSSQPPAIASSPANVDAIEAPRWNAAGVSRIRMISIAEIGIVMPIATSIAWHRDFGCPTRWSPESNRNEPIAMAGPVAAMITGAGNVRQRTDNSKPPASMPSAAFGVARLEHRRGRNRR